GYGPRRDAVVLLVPVAIVVATNDLSKGLIAGVILCSIFFVAKISRVSVTKQQEANKLSFNVQGQLFFACVDSFMNAFDFSTQNTDIHIDFSDAQICDESTVAAIDQFMQEYRENNNEVKLIGLNSSSERMVDRLAIQRI